MSKLTELRVLSKGYMKQKQDLKKVNDDLASLQDTKKIVNELQVQGGDKVDLQLFIARARDKITQAEETIGAKEVELSALQRAMTRISVELNELQQANANLSEENLRVRELVANSKGEMYEMLHNESKGNLSELATLKVENVELKSEVIALKRTVADLEPTVEQLAKARSQIEVKDIELENLQKEVNTLRKDLKLYKAQTSKSVSIDDEDMLIL